MPTPWPSWLIAAHPNADRAPASAVRAFLSGLTTYVRAFDDADARASADVAFIKERFGYPETDVREWLGTVGYPESCSVIPESVVLDTCVYVDTFFHSPITTL